MQEVTREGAAVLERARFDRGFDGRYTVLWAAEPEGLERAVARVAAGSG